jgi:hypothetical protein
MALTNRLQPGAEIVQPQSSSANDVFARLTTYAEINLPTPSKPHPQKNRVDAALARVTDNSLVQTGKILGIAKYVPKILSPTPGMVVTKSGQTTGVTKGKTRNGGAGTVSAMRINNVGVNYGTEFSPIIGTFDNCIHIRGEGARFSDRGDSGSIVLDQATGRPIGLLFAGDGVSTFANDMAEVCTQFGVLPV